MLFLSIKYWTRKVLLSEIAVFFCIEVWVLPPLHKSWTQHGIIQSERNFFPSECCNMFHNHIYKSLLKESCSNPFIFLTHFKLEPGRENTLQLHDSTLGGAQHDASQIFIDRCWKYLTVVWLHPNWTISTNYWLFVLVIFNALFRFYIFELKSYQT